MDPTSCARLFATVLYPWVQVGLLPPLSPYLSKSKGIKRIWHPNSSLNLSILVGRYKDRRQKEKDVWGMKGAWILLIQSFHDTQSHFLDGSGYLEIVWSRNTIICINFLHFSLLYFRKLSIVWNGNATICTYFLHFLLLYFRKLSIVWEISHG